MSLTSPSLSSLTLFQVFGFLFMCVCISVMSNSLRPHRLWLSRHLCPWNSEVGCHFLLQGIFLTWNQTWVSHTAGRFFTIWATREALWISFSLSNWLFLLPSLRLVLFVPIKSSSPVVFPFSSFSSVQLLSRVRHFATPWTAACQASLSITDSRSLLKLMSIESVMPPSHLILCHALHILLSIIPSSKVFSWDSSSHQVAKVLEFQHRYKSFQWTLKTDPL